MAASGTGLPSEGVRVHGEDKQTQADVAEIPEADPKLPLATARFRSAT